MLPLNGFRLFQLIFVRIFSVYFARSPSGLLPWRWLCRPASLKPNWRALVALFLKDNWQFTIVTVICLFYLWHSFVYFFDGLMVSLRQLPNLAMLDNQPLPNCFDKSSLPLCVISVVFFLTKIIDLWFSAKFSYFQQQDNMIKQMFSDSTRKAIQEVQLLLESQRLGCHIEMLCCRVSPLDE